MINIIVLDIDISYAFSEYKKFLSDVSQQRQDKISRFRFDKDKILSLFSGLIIENNISRSLNIPKDKIIFSFNSHGKPFLADYPDFHFSVSHSGNSIAFVSDTSPVGIDIEQITVAKSDISKRFFSPNEHNYIINNHNPDNAFFEIWTKKEAYLKMLGTGLSKSLSSFDVTSDELSSLFFYKHLPNYALCLCSQKDLSQNIPQISYLSINPHSLPTQF